MMMMMMMRPPRPVRRSAQWAFVVATMAWGWATVGCSPQADDREGGGAVAEDERKPPPDTSSTASASHRLPDPPALPSPPPPSEPLASDVDNAPPDDSDSAERFDDRWLRGPELFVSHRFDPANMPQARPIAAIYQNVLTKSVTARATGELAAMTLDADVTIEPGGLYEVIVQIDRRKHVAAITSPPGSYEAGQVITTDGASGIILSGQAARIDDARLNDELLRQVVRKYRAQYRGVERPLLALDWESAWLNRVTHSDHPGHARAVAEGARALDIAREEWPDAAITFYGCPWGTFQPTDAWYETIAEALSPILSRVDWLAPSLYDKLKDVDSSERALERGRRRYESTLRLACRVARGRPIVPWINHRHYQPGAAFHQQLVEEDEFIDHLRWAWRFSEHGERIDGFVLWYRDRETWEMQRIRPIGAASSVTAEAAIDDIERRRYEWIFAVMQELD